MAGEMWYSTCGARRGTYRFWWGNVRGRDPLENPGIVGRIILKGIFNK